MARILIADDDDITVELVRSTLSQRGHIVGALPDGRDVRQVVEIKRPDIVILDCAMPNVSGVEALKQVRTSATAYATPILMLTARRSTVDEDIAYRAGANDYLKKPFNPDQLIVAVEALLQDSQRHANFGR